MPGRIPEETIAEIRDRSDIAEIVEGYTPLKRRGQDLWACCPFHKEKTPSFKVSPSHQAFYCFGCRKSGNVFHFVMEMENLDFVGAVRLLAQRAGVRIPESRAGGGSPSVDRSEKERLYELLDSVAHWYRQLLRSKRGEPGRRYLEDRGLSLEEADAFDIGYSLDSWDAVLTWGERLGIDTALLEKAGLVVTREDGARKRTYDRFRGRLMFPIWDGLGRVVGFSGRILDPEAKTAKYINTPETPVFRKGRLLYALHLARTAFRDAGTAVVCEGQLDVIACHRAGLTHAVAPQGTAFTEEQARILKRYTDTVTFAFDSDEAGRKAAVRSLQVGVAQGLRVHVVALPPDADPDSLYRKQGAEAVRDALSEARDGFEYILSVAGDEHDTQSPEGKTAAANEVLETVAMVPDAVARAAYCQWLAGRLNLPEDALQQRLASRLRREQRTRSHRRRASSSDSRGSAKGAARAAPVERPVSRTDRAAVMLLDLAIHEEEIAHLLAEKVLPDMLGTGWAGQALALAVRLAAEGRWEEIGKALTAHPELSTVPDVVRVVTDPGFPPLKTEDPDDRRTVRERKRRLQAASDCLVTIEEEYLIRKRQSLTRQLAELTSPEHRERMRSVMREIQALRLREHRLRQAHQAHR